MSRTNEYGVSIALGMCLGVVVGLLLNQLAMGLALGPLFGIVLHSMRKERETAEDESAADVPGLSPTPGTDFGSR